jgi:UDP-N-acetylglucosamine--N-acetylmuramyl-(pentapeptide) pyrophosphoryl-undecaprenol N-acetylglucosamine transferase
VSAAQVVSESGLTAGELANRLATLFAGGRAKLIAMAEAARGLAVTDAAERVAALCLEAEGARA